MPPKSTDAGKQRAALRINVVRRPPPGAGDPTCQRVPIDCCSAGDAAVLSSEVSCIIDVDSPHFDKLPAMYLTGATSTISGNNINDWLIINPTSVAVDVRIGDTKVTCPVAWDQYHEFPLADSNGQHIDAKIFNDWFDILKQAKRENKNVIVFCDKGISRSATFVIAALMYFECFLTYNAAFAYVRSKRPIIEPNLGFVLRLTWLFQSDDEHLPHFLEEIGCADLAAPSAQQMPCCAEKNPFDLTC